MSKLVIGLRAPAMRSATLLLAPILLLALALTHPVTHAALPEAAAPWLQKLLSASKTLSYEGEMVYLQDGQMSTVSVLHQRGPNGVQERLIALDGTPREIVSGLKRLSCKLSSGQAVDLPLQSVGGAADLAAHLEQLNDYYIIKLGARQRIAARETQRIDLIPRSNSRYGHRLWLDVETGLPLKTQMVDTDKRVIEEAMFTHITYLAPSASDAADPQASTIAVTDDDPNATADAPPAAATAPFKLSDWHAAQLPTGFRLTTHRRIENTSSPTEQLVYSDGMASISVFIEKLDHGDSGFDGSSRRGTVTLYARTSDGHQLTIIGEVPEHTARLVGDGLEKKYSKPIKNANDSSP